MRLFFHLVSKHETIPDLEGVEVDDICEALTAALDKWKEFRQNHPFAVQHFSAWTLRVSDAGGAVVFSLDLGHPIH